jgi:predicted metal-dependent hydrolase
MNLFSPNTKVQAVAEENTDKRKKKKQVEEEISSILIRKPSKRKEVYKRQTKKMKIKILLQKTKSQRTNRRCTRSR